jgi:hypothetical protein
MIMRTKIFILLLVLLVGTSMLYAQSGTCGDKITWHLDNGVLTISGTGEMTSDPSYERLTFYRSSITSVIIHEGVTSIGEYAFFECTNLTSVTLPNSVTSIGEAAFRRCAALTSITIPTSVTSIGEDAFSACTGLTSVTIPDNVISLGEQAFFGCTSLTSVTFPNSITSVGRNAFYNCSALTSPVYNDHVFAYLPERYSGAYSIPEGISAIAPGACCNCLHLTEVTIPNSVTTIGDEAFWGCDSLTSITIPSGVTTIGEYAFFSCEKITSFTSEAATPPTLGTKPLFGEEFSPAVITLFVPKAFVRAYKKSPWRKQFKYIQAIKK